MTAPTPDNSSSTVIGDPSIRDIEFLTTAGEPATLADFAGKVVLIVNVASKCGLTPQYEGLQRLYDEHKADGLVVLAFPANDFMGQEPGSDAEIAEFCSLTYDVSFPLMAKIGVIGPDKHPLYAELIRRQPAAEGKDTFREGLRGNGITPTEDPEVLWNFEKFLLDRNADPVARFAPDVTAEDPTLLTAVQAALSNDTRES